MKIRDIISEVASVGATSAANIATVASPHIAVGPDRFKKSYTGTPASQEQRLQDYQKLYNLKRKTAQPKALMHYQE